MPTYIGTPANDVVGNAHPTNDFYTILYGRAGNDYLWTTAFDALIAGEDGNDTIGIANNGARGRLYGGAGNDYINGGYYADRLEGGDGDDALIGGYGDGHETGDDILLGGAGRDRLEGQGGNDQLFGGEGDDGGTPYILPGSGALGPGPFATPPGLFGGDGDDLLDGGAGSDWLDGGAGTDRLVGGDGADRLDGGAGGDLMTGGLGDDSYRVDEVGDRVVETAGGGIDTVLLYPYVPHAGEVGLWSYTLPAFIENAVMDGVILSLFGNDLDNRLTGSPQDNVIDGGAGIDVMAGGLGDDTFRVDNLRDTVIEIDGYNRGYDTVITTVSKAFTEGSIEAIRLDGWGSINTTGGAAATRIIGNSGDNGINGGDGNDLLTGGAGRDSFVFDTAPSVSNRDRITDFTPADDTIQLDDAVFTALARGALPPRRLPRRCRRHAARRLRPRYLRYRQRPALVRRRRYRPRRTHHLRHPHPRPLPHRRGFPRHLTVPARIYIVYTRESSSESNGLQPSHACDTRATAGSPEAPPPPRRGPARGRRA